MSPDAPLADTSDMPAVHEVFRETFGIAPELIASAASDPQRRAVISNFYMNILSFLEVHHDGEEVLVFPLLSERAPEQSAIVDKAQSDHESVLGLLDDARSSVETWDSEGDTAAQDAVIALTSLGTALTSHLDFEEDEILPIAAANVTAEEWGKLPGHALGSFDGDKVWLIMGLIRENFTDEQRGTMLANMPPPAREMWETMGEASFNELISQIRQID